MEYFGASNRACALDEMYGTSGSYFVLAALKVYLLV
jgi:hypothetical protein